MVNMGINGNVNWFTSDIKQLIKIFTNLRGKKVLTHIKPRQIMGDAKIKGTHAFRNVHRPTCNLVNHSVGGMFRNILS